MDSKNFYQSLSVIFREGEEARQVFIIRSGEVICLKNAKDRLVPVFTAKQGDVIGETAMVADGTYTYSALAVSQVELLPIPNGDFKQVMELAPPWLSELTITMLNRFHVTSKMVAENRLLHPVIVSEEDFPSSLEIEYKKILGQ